MLVFLGLVAITWLTAAPIRAAATNQRVVLPTGVAPLRYDLRITPDLKALTFAGQVTVQLNVAKPVRNITLNAVDLGIDAVELDAVIVHPKLRWAVERGELGLEFPEILQPGRHTLGIKYRGKINTATVGLFALDYDGPTGLQRAIFTQFENADARRFMPCWDEPARKAIFRLSVDAPVEQMVVSNMPITSTRPLSGGLKHVEFAVTPRMSTYLVFLAMGDFVRVSRKVDGVDLGVVVRRGQDNQAAFALDAMAKLLPYYNDYFGVRYPLPKLDFISGPGSSPFFGAMENWGAMFGFEKEMFVDPTTGTEAERKAAFATIAHEMGHQWFGDLVTMGWWDDLWLNEGFTDWMEGRATGHFHPEWGGDLARVAERDGAMGLDSRTGSHPVVQPIQDALQAGGAFDGISYNKGSAVIRMLGEAVGATRFRIAIRRYMRTHAYGNASTGDFLRELSRSGGPEFRSLGEDYLYQAGVPLVEVASTEPGLQLRQSRFGVDASSKVATSWRVPVKYRELPGGAVRSTMLAPGTHAALIKGAAILNEGQTGYYRTAYDEMAFAALAKQLPTLSSIDQLGLIYDAYALGYGGYEPLSRLLDLVHRLPLGADPVVWDAVVGKLVSIDSVYDEGPARTAFRTFIRDRLAPLKTRLGWDPEPHEPSTLTSLRGSLLRALSQFDDPAIVAEARARFSAHRSDLTALGPETRAIVLDVVAEHADLETVAAFRQLAASAASAGKKREFTLLAASPRDQALATQALELALQPGTDQTMGPAIIRRVSERHPRIALDFALANLEVLNSRLDETSRAQFIPRLLGATHDRALAERLTAFAAEHIPASGRAALDQKLSAVSARAMLHDDRLPEMDAWLANQSRNGAPAGD